MLHFEEEVIQLTLEVNVKNYRNKILLEKSQQKVLSEEFLVKSLTRTNSMLHNEEISKVVTLEVIHYITE